LHEYAGRQYSPPPAGGIAQAAVRADDLVATYKAPALGTNVGVTFHGKLASQGSDALSVSLTVSMFLVKEKAMARYVELEIVDVSYGGLSVGRHEERVIFVPYAVTGDQIVAEIVKTKRRFSYARLVEVKKASPWRVPAPCPYFGACGGCMLQHVNYDYQLELKRFQVREIFRRIGRYEDVKVEPTIPSPRGWHYRGKMEFHGALRSDGRVAIGLRRLRGHEIVEIDRCLIAHESINRALDEARKGNPLGRLTLWANDDGMGPYVLRQVKGRQLKVPRGTFFQANLFLVEKLVDIVLEMCELKGKETVLDAYCGVGLFTVFLALKAAKVVGVEVDELAAEAAKVNVGALSLGLCEIWRGDVGQVLEERAADLKGKVGVVVIDPPRGGLSRRALDGILQLGAQRIVYVSCNPATMARDGAVFSLVGYELTQLVPLDMFPQTAHIEVVGRWEKL